MWPKEWDLGLSNLAEGALNCQEIYYQGAMGGMGGIEDEKMLWKSHLAHISGKPIEVPTHEALK
jgi:hypothetical protein